MQLFGGKPQSEAQHVSIVLIMVVIRGMLETIKMGKSVAGKTRYLETVFGRETPNRLLFAAVLRVV